MVSVTVSNISSNAVSTLKANFGDLKGGFLGLSSTIDMNELYKAAHLRAGWAVAPAYPTGTAGPSSGRSGSLASAPVLAVQRPVRVALDDPVDVLADRLGVDEAERLADELGAH